MKAAHKIFLVTTGPDGTHGLSEVNDRLRQGWRVANVAPLGGGGAAQGFAALVVLERGEDAAESVLEQIEEEMERLPGALGEAVEGNGGAASLPDEDEIEPL